MNHSPTLVSRILETLQVLPSIIGTILIGASAVFADDSPFYVTNWKAATA